MGTRLYFAAGDVAGTELWKVQTDGDVEMVADIRPGEIKLAVERGEAEWR